MTLLELQDLVMQRGQHADRPARANHPGALRQGTDGQYTASCARCGAMLVVAVRSAVAGSWGAATRTACQAGERVDVHLSVCVHKSTGSYKNYYWQ